MPYVYKTKDLLHIPECDEMISLTSNKSHVNGSIQVGETIFVFVENGKALGKFGGLVGRGILETLEPNLDSFTLGIRFDGQVVSIPLATRSLDRFAHPTKYSLPEVEQPTLQQIFPLLSEIAEIRRNTNLQPLHEISEEAADWLNLYHIEKDKL